MKKRDSRALAFILSAILTLSILSGCVNTPVVEETVSAFGTTTSPTEQITESITATNPTEETTTEEIKHV